MGRLGIPIPPFTYATSSPYPSQEPPPPGLRWKTIDWNSKQLVLVYYCLTFLNQVQFLNFRHIFSFNFLYKFHRRLFFMNLTIFWWLFIHCEMINNFVRNYSKPKKCQLSKSITFLEKLKIVFISQTYIFLWF